MIKYEKDKKRIGKIIKDIRGNQMMTEFAFKLGITKGTLNNYEKGRSIPSKELLLKILNYSDKEISLNEVLYGSSISYLLDIFKDVDSLKPLYFDSDETPVFKSSNIVINELNKLILSGDLSFGDEKNIISFVKIS
ncbi:helix-turn-helix domain-containing protein [Macrococcoides caseolyticum]|nr:XRE family transcriptional regulator [Macrococcus caseolyticus]RKO12963.1 XRE family transcriptional regulator [Macrococcus caseolyticus]